MFGLQTGRPAILLNTVKIVLVVGGLSLSAAHWLSSGGLDRTALSRLAGGVDEPLTTGSIVPSRAGSTRLDPCRLPAR